MKRHAHLHKANESNTDTEEDGVPEQISVTSTTLKSDQSSKSRHSAKTQARSLRAREQPKARARLLDPWLKLANLVRPYLSAGEPSRDAPSRFIEDFRRCFNSELKRLQDAPFGGSELALPNSPIHRISMLLEIHEAICALSGVAPEDPKWLADPMPAWLFRISRCAADVFEALSLGRKETPSQLLPVDFKAGSDGRVRARFHVSRMLLKAIEGSEVARFVACAVCGKFFYVLRLAEGEMACSEQCQLVRRARAWRRREKERLARAKRLIHAGKNVIETAVALRVSPKKACRYVTATQRKTI